MFIFEVNAGTVIECAVFFCGGINTGEHSCLLLLYKHMMTVH